MSKIIWKKEKCLKGECAEGSDSHSWSLPSFVPQGLCSECLKCKKQRIIKT